MTTRTAGGIGSGLLPAVSFAPRGADDPIHLFVGQLPCAGLCRSRQVPHHIEEFAFHGFILAVAHNDKKAEFAGKLVLGDLAHIPGYCQAPLLTRAQELFSALTLQTFPGLTTEYDEDQDRTRLKGIRSTDEIVGTEGLSIVDSVYGTQMAKAELA